MNIAEDEITNLLDKIAIISFEIAKARRLLYEEAISPEKIESMMQVVREFIQIKETERRKLEDKKDKKMKKLKETNKL